MSRHEADSHKLTGITMSHTLTIIFVIDITSTLHMIIRSSQSPWWHSRQVCFQESGGYSTETAVTAHKIGYLGRWEHNTFTFVEKKKMAYYKKQNLSFY